MRPALQAVLAIDGIEAKVCGFGPIASGIRTAQLLAEFQPSSCLLVGIAGTYQSSLAIGSAYEFCEIACYGIGAGSGPEFTSSSKMGWRQWPEKLIESLAGDVLQLPSSKSTSRRFQLLTVCAASGNEQDVTQRLRLHPSAVAEDMEAFAVALACLSSKVPLTIIRGISNQAGDREQSRWAVKPAIEAACQLATTFLGASSKGSS